jgi:hypothetical protein
VAEEITVLTLEMFDAVTALIRKQRVSAHTRAMARTAAPPPNLADISMQFFLNLLQSGAASHA